MKGFYALERNEEKPVFPNVGRNYKAEGGILISRWQFWKFIYTVSSKVEVDTLQPFLSVFVVMGCSRSAKTAPSTGEWRKFREGGKKTWLSILGFIGLWLVVSWLRPGSPEALLVFPSPSSSTSTLGRSHTWKQRVDHLGIGSSGCTRKIHLFPLTLAS